MPSFDERLRAGLEGMARQGEPDAAFDPVVAKRSRRRMARRVQVTGLAVAVVAGTAGGVFGLTKVFSGPAAPQPAVAITGSAEPTPSESPNASPSETPSESPSASATPSGPFIGYACGESKVHADFDGDGLPDTALVHWGELVLDHPPSCPSTVPTEVDYKIEVAWGAGAAGAWPLPECDTACGAHAAHDIDGNGTAELALLVDEGASTQLIEFLELPPSEAGPILFEVVPPGTEQHQGDEALEAATGGSVTHQDFVTCRAEPTGAAELVTTSAMLSEDQTTWNLAETVFSFDGSATPSGADPRVAQAFTVASTRDYTEPADPNGDAPTVEGEACFVPA